MNSVLPAGVIRWRRLAQRQYIRDFEMPYRRDGSCFVGKALEYSVRSFSGFVLEAPAQRDGRVENEVRHRRPSLISCLTGTSNV